MPKLIPVLRYRDPSAAIRWLTSTFGFQSHFVAEESGEVVHAQLRCSEDLLMLGPDHADDKYSTHSPLAFAGTSQRLYVALDGDVDEACNRARASGAEIITPPYATAYGSKEFSCRDPEGHVWSFGSYAGEPVTG